METLTLGTSETGEMDRISNLPGFILHHILSFIHGHRSELVRLSVLSKTWFRLIASFPFLYFNIHSFTPVRESFFKYVEYTTSRFCHYNLTVSSLSLIASIQEPAELDIINRCLGLLLKQGVKVLEIDITDFIANYRLPNILLSVSVLESLTIRNCNLPSSLMLDAAVKFTSLIKLELVHVHVDDEMIIYLTTSCPLLQIFRIHNCPGFKRFCVYGHQNLQDVSIYCETPGERIDIEAPNLSTLFITDSNGRSAPQLNLALCKKLTTVTYKGYPLPNSNDFLSNFPFVENLLLTITTTSKSNNLKLSSKSLRILVLHSDCDLEGIEFNTPNLVAFSCLRYFSSLWPMVSCIQWPLLRESTHLKACMQCFPRGYIGTLWILKLRQFLDKKNGFKVLNLYIHAKYIQQLIELEKLKAIELPPYELEHVELKLDTHEESSAHVTFVGAVLWCCRPRSLTLRPSVPLIDLKDVAKFTYTKLLEQENQGHTNIQIVWPSSSETQKRLRDMKSLSVALPREGQAISFIKEEVIQEEAG